MLRVYYKQRAYSFHYFIYFFQNTLNTLHINYGHVYKENTKSRQAIFSSQLLKLRTLLNKCKQTMTAYPRHTVAIYTCEYYEKKFLSIVKRILIYSSSISTKFAIQTKPGNRFEESHDHNSSLGATLSVTCKMPQ